MNTQPMLGEDRGGKDGCGLDLELVLQSDREKFSMGRKKPSRKKPGGGTTHQDQGDSRTP